MLPIVRVETRFKPFVEDELDAAWPAPARRLLAHPGAGRDLRVVLPEPTADTIVLAIGPEGGWVPFEVELLEARGFERFSAGEHTLRVDTAVSFLVGQAALCFKFNLAP